MGPSAEGQARILRPRLGALRGRGQCRRIRYRRNAPPPCLLARRLPRRKRAEAGGALYRLPLGNSGAPCRDRLLEREPRAELRPMAKPPPPPPPAPPNLGATETRTGGSGGSKRA